MIEGDVTLETVTSPISSATLYVRVEDVSRADTSSIVIAEIALTDISLQPGGDQRLPFQLEVPAMDRHDRYILSAHLDVDNSGTITLGDYLTMESIPVGEGSLSDRVSLPARRVA